MLEVAPLLTARANPACSFAGLIEEDLRFSTAIQAWETGFDIQSYLLFLLVWSLPEYINEDRFVSYMDYARTCVYLIAFC